YGNDDEDAKDTARKEGFLGSLTRWRRGGRPNRAQREEDERRRVFRIPGKVRDRKHVIHDELTDLTQTFNEMSDELMMQYERLEERVKQRTAELELSKKAAEAANESKTLFIANISHELKTPLNGILGMCAVCMQEDDPTRLKRSLGIIYKSGDLLLNLLTDLLTFSKNQVGQQLSLDEKEFRLRDISSQVLAIFDKQSKEGQIDLEVKFQGLQETETSDLETANDIKEHGPFGFGRLKDMTLWGDQHRILQVVINLVSNSLKFTGPGGKVVLSIKCLGAAPSDGGSRKTSVMSKQSRLTSVGDSKHRSKLDSDISVLPQSKYTNTANEINITDKGRAYAQIMAAERSPSPPLGRNLLFEFEVEDTGPGIAEHQQQRIFEPFVQGDLGLSKKYGGTGLGLSICSQLTGLMRGTISLKSQVGVGSTFTMRIPLRHILNRADSTASSRVDVGGFNSRRSSVEESRASPARPPPDDARSSRSLHSANSAPTTVAPVTFEADSQPRL
ncbi:Histidine kinase osmosensor, partial [Cryomyces antarcticus]